MKEQVSDQNAPEVLKFSNVIKSGYGVSFDYEDQKITCWCSGVSGKETVYVNDKLVSELRNLVKRKAIHNFRVNGRKFELEVNTVSFKQGEVHFVLIKDGIHVETKKVRISSPSNRKPFSLKNFLLTLPLYAFAGYIVGYTYARYSKHGEFPPQAFVELFNKVFGL